MTSKNDGARRTGTTNILVSPRLALSLLVFLAVYIGTVSWFPWTLDRRATAPGWASATGLDQPFSSAIFLTAVFLLLANTLACTIDRTSRVSELVSGEIPIRAKTLTVSGGGDALAFLKEQGFRTGSGPPYFKNRFALTKGLLFHAGLVLLILGVFAQQAFHDSGSFEIGEGEIVRLSDAGVVFDRNAGLLAPAALPGIRLALEQFDPFLHQDGYAPDRASTLLIRTKDPEQRITLDRARGIRVDGLTIHHALPFGLTLNIEIEGLGAHSLHLRQVSSKQAEGEFKAPSGMPALFLVETERDIVDPLGTGAIRITLVQGREKTALSAGRSFAFGDRAATIISVSRWAGFTFSRSPGVSMVFTGFFLLLAGTVVMLVPAGVAAGGGDDTPGSLRVYLTSGVDDFEQSWYRFQKSRDL